MADFFIINVLLIFNVNLMNYEQLVEQIFAKESFLCVGLDTDYAKIPQAVKGKGKFTDICTFNREIIEATAPYAVAYKLNSAFYESEGLDGWKALAATIEYLRKVHPEILVILDAKRADIGNSSERYAVAAFDVFGADAVTVSPYMGHDSVAPFLTHEDKWAIILAHTSNAGSLDFQTLSTAKDTVLYQQVLKSAAGWGTQNNTMFVIGATHPETFSEIRKIIPKHFLLVPGVGAQGGDLQAVAKNGMTPDCGLLVNASRSIIYASQDSFFACTAKDKAVEMQKEMAELLATYSHMYKQQ